MVHWLVLVHLAVQIKAYDPRPASGKLRRWVRQLNQVGFSPQQDRLVSGHAPYHASRAQPCSENVTPTHKLSTSCIPDETLYPENYFHYFSDTNRKNHWTTHFGHDTRNHTPQCVNTSPGAVHALLNHSVVTCAEDVRGALSVVYGISAFHWLLGKQQGVINIHVHHLTMTLQRRSKPRWFRHRLAVVISVCVHLRLLLIYCKFTRTWPPLS